MVSSNKILTVSYGTFSCTLEGFDESFETMKAIAEYFRDLAADDRYFGAEPPTPDAEMLARIAEREIARRVEARMDSGGIVLRPSLEAAAPSSETQQETRTAGRPETATQEPPVAQPQASAADDPQEDGPAEDSATPVDGGLEPSVAAQVATPDDGAPEPEAPSRPETGESDPAHKVTKDGQAGDATHDTVALVEEAPEAGFDAAMEAEAERLAKTPDENDAEVATAAPAEAVEPRGAQPPEAVEDAAESAEIAAPDGRQDELLSDTQGTRGGAPAEHDEPPAEVLAPEHVPPRPAAMPGSVAAKLQRIRAVVARATGAQISTSPSRDEEPDEEETNLFRDDDAQPVTRARVVRMSRADFEAAVAAGTIAPQPGAAQREKEPRATGEAEDTTRAEGDGPPADRSFDTTAVDSAPETDLDGEMPESVEQAETDTEEGQATGAEHDPEHDAEEAVVAPHAAPAFEGDSPSRVGDDAEAMPGTPEPRAGREPTRSSLSPADEAELVAELRGIEAELYGTSGATTEQATAEEAVAPAEPAPGTAELLDSSELDAADAQISHTVARDDHLETSEAQPDQSNGDFTQDADAAQAQPEETEEVASADAPEGDVPRALRDEAATPDAGGAGSRIPEDEAPEEEAAPDTAEDTPEPSPEVAAAARRAVRQTSDAFAAVSARPEGNGDDNVSRLMDEAETEMERPEATRRRSALAHLRAAVAATRGDQRLARSGPAEEEVQAYRNDLSAAVRPRRPETISARTPRPEEPRPAPLKLVAEQRVDLPAGEERAPVRPRRVNRPAHDAAQTPRATEGFESYARARGAHELPELMEAAVAYVVFVEGHEQFSRPQVMKTVRASGLADFNREDGLRHFGQLIRAGKIEKQRGGRFTVSDEIGYRPEGRAAG